MRYNAFLRGEDRTEFTIEVEANSIEDAEREVEERYPEATIVEIYDPLKREVEILRYDDDLNDDYDY